VRSNRRPTINISSLPPLDVDLRDHTARLTCPDCGRYVKIERGLAAYHERESWTRNERGALASKRSHCPGTRQHYTFDLTVKQHAAARAAALKARRAAEAKAVSRAAHRTRPPGQVTVVHDAARHATPVYGTGSVAHPPVMPRREAKPSQVAGWSGQESAFADPGELWNTARRLDGRPVRRAAL
jgi:hypothetical protein